MATAPDPTDDLERIVIDPQILVGKPVIKGTRIPVALILSLLAHGYDVDRVVQAYPVLSRADVLAALHYAEVQLEREEIRPFQRWV